MKSRNQPIALIGKRFTNPAVLVCFRTSTLVSNKFQNILFGGNELLNNDTYDQLFYYVLQTQLTKYYCLQNQK